LPWDGCGGIPGNAGRILPSGCRAVIDLSRIKVLPLFKLIREQGNVAAAEMVTTFNLGVGMVLVVAGDSEARIVEVLRQHQCDSYPIGKIIAGEADVELEGRIKWK
jgi:phosphoribosylformylglycinamidine cyclo-ligase